MALHGLAEITLGVPDVAAAGSFYREFVHPRDVDALAGAMAEAAS